MPRFKLHQRCDQYTTAWVEAPNKEEALRMAQEDALSWDHADYDGGEIIAIDECDEKGNIVEYHYLECDDDGKEQFHDSVPAQVEEDSDG